MSDFVGGHGRNDDGERPEHFHAGNLDRIRDAPPNATLAVTIEAASTLPSAIRRNERANSSGV